MSPRIREHLNESEAHKKLVKMALKRAVDEYDDICIINMHEMIGSISAELKVENIAYDSYGSERRRAHKGFVPDIVLGVFKRLKNPDRTRVKLTAIECETTKHGILKDTYRLTAYKLLKIKQDEDDGGLRFELILAIYDDLGLDETPKPFDKVWKFPRVEGDHEN